MNPILPADTNGALAILTLLANPGAAKEQLEKIIAEKKAATDALEKTRAAAKENDAASAKILETQRDLSKKLAANDKRASELEARFSTLNDLRAKLDSERSAFDARVKKTEAEFYAREIKVAARERAVSETEQRLQRTLAQADSVRAEYTEKVSRLKQAVG